MSRGDRREGRKVLVSKKRSSVNQLQRGRLADHRECKPERRRAIGRGSGRHHGEKRDARGDHEAYDACRQRGEHLWKGKPITCIARVRGRAAAGGCVNVRIGRPGRARRCGTSKASRAPRSRSPVHVPSALPELEGDHPWECRFRGEGPAERRQNVRRVPAMLATRCSSGPAPPRTQQERRGRYARIPAKATLT